MHLIHPGVGHCILGENTHDVLDLLDIGALLDLGNVQVDIAPKHLVGFHKLILELLSLAHKLVVLSILLPLRVRGPKLRAELGKRHPFASLGLKLRLTMNGDSFFLDEVEASVLAPRLPEGFLHLDAVEVGVHLPDLSRLGFHAKPSKRLGLLHSWRSLHQESQP